MSVVRIDSEANSFTLSVIDINVLAKGMVLVPNFDPDCMPLSLTWNMEGGHYELSDIRGKGWHGSIDGLDEVEVLG